MAALRVLLLAGTPEARRLAAAVGARPEIELTSSLADAVAVPLLPEGDVRIGCFDGVEGLTGGCATTPPTPSSTPPIRSRRA